MFRVEFGIFFGFISKVFNATENKRAYRENKLHLDLSLKKFELYEYAISTKTLINFFISKKKYLNLLLIIVLAKRVEKVSIGTQENVSSTTFIFFYC